MGRTEELLANLRELKSRKGLEEKNLKELIEKANKAKLSIKKIDKEVADIIDELSGIKTFPILDAIAEVEAQAQTQTQEVSKPLVGIPVNDNFKKSFHEQYQESRLKDPFDIWVTPDRKIEMTFRGERKTFGDNTLIGHLCAFFRVSQLSDISQISLAELWHNTEQVISQVQPKPKLIKPQTEVKPNKTKPNKKKISADREAVNL